MRGGLSEPCGVTYTRGRTGHITDTVRSCGHDWAYKLYSSCMATRASEQALQGLGRLVSSEITYPG